MKKTNLLERLNELKTSIRYMSYIHGVDLDSSIDQIAETLLKTKEFNVPYIYDLKGVDGLYWAPKSRYISNQNINSVDDVYTFITGMNKVEYLDKIQKRTKK